MRILFLGNNRLACRVLEWLGGRDERIVGLVLHPLERRRCGDRLIRASGLPAERVFDGSRLGEPEILDAVGELEPTLGLSVLFGYILTSDFLRLFPDGCLNLHPALLPHNRGAYPNVWSIVEGTPAGATLHYIDEGIDTGDLVAQREVEVEPVDTGGSLYERLEEASFELFKETWPRFRAGEISPEAQDREGGSFHRLRDVEEIDHIELDRTYTARELIDVIRARTFPPYPGAYFVHEGRKVYLRLRLLYEEDLERERDE